MRYQRFAGNTLAEYGIMAAVLIVVGVGGYGLYGNTVLELWMKVNSEQSARPMQNLVSLNFGSGGGSTVPSPSLSSDPGNAFPNALTGISTTSSVTNTLQNTAMQTGTAFGTNATAAEGTTNLVNFGPPSFQSALGSAMQMEQLAQQTTNPDLKEFLTRTAKYGYQTAGTEAYVETSLNPETNTSVKAMAEFMGDIGTAHNVKSSGLQGKSLAISYNTLLNQKRELQAMDGVSVSDKAAAFELINGTLNSLKQEYGNLLPPELANGDLWDHGWDNSLQDKQLNLNLDDTTYTNLRQTALTALSGQQLTKTPAIKTAVSDSEQLKIRSGFALGPDVVIPSR